MQQQQMAQQQAMPQGPMPVPAGVPQPQQQPEAMMARGGLAGIPVRRDMFEYAGGGIIAFQSGGQSLNERAARQMKEKGSIYDPYFGLPAEERERMKEQAALKAAQDRARESMAVTESNAQALSGGAQARVAELEANRDSLIRQYGAKQYEQALSKAKSEVNAASARGSELMAQQSQMGQSRVAEATPPPKPPAPAPVEQASLRAMDKKMMLAGLPGAAQQMGANAAPTSLPAAPRPSMAAAQMPAAAAVAPQAGLLGAAAAMTPQDEVAKLSLEAVRTPAKAMTPEEAMAQEGKFAAQYGLDKKFGEEERGLLALMKQRQADFAKRRPMEELGATLRGFGQGYGGASAAGERAGRETYEMDMANQREMLNAINAINKENLATGKERYKSGSGLFGKSEESAAAANRQRTETLGQMRNKDADVATAAANRLNNIEVEKLRIAERQAERNQPGSAAKVRAEYLNMMDQVFALEDKGEKAQADALRRRADARLTAGGAGATGSERNDIKATETLLKNQQAIISDPLSSKADKEEARRKSAEYTRQLEKLGGVGGESSTGNPLPPNASAKNLVVGTVYQTAKGPAKWTGTGFMPI
jgi:hypothetical protein